MLHRARVDPDHGKVCFRIGADELGWKNATVMQRDLKFMSPVHDVAVGKNEPVARDNKARAATLPALTAQHADIHYARRDALDDCRDSFRIRVEKLIVGFDRTRCGEDRVFTVAQRRKDFGY